MFFVLGSLILAMSTFDAIQKKDFEEVYLRFTAGFILFIPGLYILIIAIKTKMGYLHYKWEDIAHFEDEDWWKQDVYED